MLGILTATSRLAGPGDRESGGCRRAADWPLPWPNRIETEGNAALEPNAERSLFHPPFHARLRGGGQDVRARPPDAGRKYV